MKNAKERVKIHTPYIICNDMMYNTWEEIAQKVPDFSIMTNSVANNGNPFGAFVPTIKISSNTALAEKKTGWIDFNAGGVLEGKSFEEVEKELFHEMLEVASGRHHTKNEEYGYREISIFRDGVTL